MKTAFAFTASARRDLAKLPAGLRKRVERKIGFYLSAPGPLAFAKSLVNLPPATHRFRIGNLRIKFFRQGDIFYITGIGHRSSIYR